MLLTRTLCPRKGVLCSNQSAKKIQGTSLVWWSKLCFQEFRRVDLNTWCWFQNLLWLQNVLNLLWQNWFLSCTKVLIYFFWQLYAREDTLFTFDDFKTHESLTFISLQLKMACFLIQLWQASLQLKTLWMVEPMKHFMSSLQNKKRSHLHTCITSLPTPANSASKLETRLKQSWIVRCWTKK